MSSSDAPSLALSWRQRAIAGGAVAVAFAILILGIVTGGSADEPEVVLSQSPVDGGGTRDGEAVPLVIDPVESWFPAAGEGSACSEAVGVDLLSGYMAILTINGVQIPENETNVYLRDDSIDPNANPNAQSGTRTLTAGGSQGQVTWGPEPDCPFGEILRPTGNTVSACVYRIQDGPANCRRIDRPDAFDF